MGIKCKKSVSPFYFISLKKKNCSQSRQRQSGEYHLTRINPLAPLYKRETTKLVTTAVGICYTHRLNYRTTFSWRWEMSAAESQDQISSSSLSLSHGGNIFKFHLFLFTCMVSWWEEKKKKRGNEEEEEANRKLLIRIK